MLLAAAAVGAGGALLAGSPRSNNDAMWSSEVALATAAAMARSTLAAVVVVAGCCDCPSPMVPTATLAPVANEGEDGLALLDVLLPPGVAVVPARRAVVGGDEEACVAAG